jgi:hypothetical protein
MVRRKANTIVANAVDEPVIASADVATVAEKPICILCEDDLIDSDKTAEYECGCHHVHSRCMLRSAYVFMRNYGNFKCASCQTVLIGWDFGNATALDGDNEADLLANLENLKNQKPFKEGLKKIKKKRTECGKATVAFKRRLNEEYKKYNNITQVSVLNIRLAKNESIKAIRQTEEYKAAISKTATFTTMINRFKRVHNLGWRETQLLKLNGTLAHRRWYRSRPKNLVLRKFRIRL